MSLIRETDGPGYVAGMVLVLGVLMAAFAIAGQAPTVERSKPVPGDTVIVAWDCFPVMNAQPGDTPLVCAGETVTVARVESDGWWTVLDVAGRTWRVNPARATGYSIVAAPGKAASLTGGESLSTASLSAHAALRSENQ